MAMGAWGSSSRRRRKRCSTTTNSCVSSECLILSPFVGGSEGRHRKFAQIIFEYEEIAIPGHPTVKIRYCDGASFTGDVEAVNPWVTKLHFRGARVWLAVIEELLAKGMEYAENLSSSLANWY